jgi:hypothetical protein
LSIDGTSEDIFIDEEEAIPFLSEIILFENDSVEI